MKFLLSLLSIVILGINVQAQNTPSKYKKALADSLGADEYGMKMYVLVLLKGGTNALVAKAQSDSLFSGHMQNIKRLADAGQLSVAGPLQKNDKDYRGIFILNVKTIAEAKALLATDPAIRAGLLDSELYSWYGSAALPLYLHSVEAIQKKSF